MPEPAGLERLPRLFLPPTSPPRPTPNTSPRREPPARLAPHPATTHAQYHLTTLATPSNDHHPHLTHHPAPPFYICATAGSTVRSACRSLRALSACLRFSLSPARTPRPTPPTPTPHHNWRPQPSTDLPSPDMPCVGPSLAPLPTGTMAHPFSALPPDLQGEQLTAADAWPLLSIALDSQQPPRLLASARHMPANVDVLSIPLAGSSIEASPLLWWFAFTEQLTENEISLLTTHHDASWLPYASCMNALIDWGARASTLDQATLASAALAHISPFSPDRPPSIPLRRLLDLLAFEEAIKPKVARVALLHWLATWAAQQTGSRLACPPLSCVFDPASPHVRVPAPCPLSAQRWYTELNHRKDDGSIRTPNISTAITAAARRANPQAEDPLADPGVPAPAAAPAPPNASQPSSLLPPRPQPPQPAAPTPSGWETLFQAGPAPSSQDTLSLLNGLSSVPEADAHQTAMCIVAMGKNCHLPPRTVQHLSVSTSTANLVLAAKGA